MKTMMTTIKITLVALGITAFATTAQAAYTDDCITFLSTASFSLHAREKSWDGTLWTSTNKSSWKEWNGEEVWAARTGGTGSYILYVRGNDKNTKISPTHRWGLVGTAGIACTGNIETLRGATGDNPSPTPMADECYRAMFAGNELLTAAPSLPATTLSKNCYWCMFQRCTSLETAPALPATAVAYGCYEFMFQDCTSLKAPPALPATTLANRCYYGMFWGCTSLTSAPDLPAMVLTDECYIYMFYSCANLVDVPELPATTLTEWCCNSMFHNCTSLEVNSAPPGKEWKISATTEALNWGAAMFLYTAGTLQDQPELNTTYYIKSAPEPKPEGGPYKETIDGIEWTFMVDGNLEANVDGASPVVGDIEIPTKLGGRSVTSIGEWAFGRCASLTSVVIPSSVTTIEKHAFDSCSGLTSVTIPSSVTIIDEWAFYQCNKLKNITIPSDLKSVGKAAFRGCGITSVTIPAGLTTIAEDMFRECAALTGIDVPSNVTSIEKSAFEECTNLRSVKLPKGLTSIGDSAFEECSSLTSISIPEGVTSIERKLFSNCYSLTSVTIPSSVTSIGERAFYWCTSLKSMTIPFGVTVIDERAFADCSLLKKIDFEGAPPSGVENAEIKKDAAIRYNVAHQSQWLPVIRQCGWTNAKPYTPAGPLPPGGPYTEKVGSTTWTFMVDDDLEAVVGTGAYVGETAIPTSTKGAVTIPSELGERDVAAIADYAFAGCSKVTAVTIPAGVEEIGVEVFDGCSSLTAINVAAGNESYSSVDGVLFDGDMTTLIQCPGGKQGAYEVPDDVERIGDYAFADCAKITDVTLTSDVTGIGAHAFMDCGMARITIPSSVRTIGEDAFLSCDDLKTVYVDEGDERRVKTLMERSGFDTDQVEFRIIGETPTFEVVAGMKVSIDVGFVGYTAKNLPKGLAFNTKTGLVTGTTKVTGTYEATFSKKGEWDETAIFEVRDEEDPEIDCPGLEEGEFTVGVAGASGGIPIGISAESGVKSVSAKNLPAGMKVAQDKLTKEWYITGGPTRAGYYSVTLTVTTAAGNKADQSYDIEVAALPDMAVGAFNGFVTKQDNAERFDPVIGAIQVTATDAGKISAKVTTADKAYSFTAACWDSGKEGRYSVEMSLKTGETLTLELDTTAGWDEHQLTGSFDHKVLSGPFDVSAQRNAFGKTWSFDAEGDETDGWTLAYAENPKTADLTLTLNADGKTTLSGKLGTLKVSASGYSDVSGMRGGALIADFAPVVTVNKGKTILSIHTNLWFDRSNEHEFIGSAKLMD